MFLGERRISLSWIVHGQIRMSTSLQSLLGLGSESPRSSTIGSDGWLLNTIVLRNWFLAGPSTDRVPAEILHPPMNFLTLLSLGLGTQIHGLERLGRRGKDLRSLSLIVEHYWYWMVWSRSKIRLVHKKDGFVNPPFR